MRLHKYENPVSAKQGVVGMFELFRGHVMNHVNTHAGEIATISI
jgi:hypothetical protein